MKVNALTLGIAALVWILAFAGSLAGSYVFISKKLPKPQPVAVVEEPQETKEVSALDKIPQTKDDVKAVVNELTQWRGDLEKQRDKLLQLDTDIQRRETLIKAEKDALLKEREKVEQLQKALDGKIKEYESKRNADDEQQAQSVKDMASLFGKMKIDQAINLIKEYPDEQVAKMFNFFPKKQLAKLLETWSRNYPNDRERLVRVTEELRRVAKQDAIGNSASTPPAP